MNYVHYSKPDTKEGELMNQEKPLIDYAPHRRCDDDIKLADKFAFASKVVGVSVFGFTLWLIVMNLAFNAAGA